MRGAPFFAEVAEAPAGTKAYWITTTDGLEIRIAAYTGGDKGTVLLFPGRTEYIEKYGRTAAEFASRGFSTVIIDWRGQGLSPRQLKNRLVGHVDDFLEYQLDVEAVVSVLPKLDLPKPFGLVAHSMGGCIGLRALMRGLEVTSAAFTGPMWTIATPVERRYIGWALAAVSRPFGFDEWMTPGTVDTPYVQTHPFEDNMLTRDRDMWDYMSHHLSTHPDLSLGGPSLAWLHEAFKECRTLGTAPTPPTPCLTFLGTNERIVDVPAVKNRMARWHNGTLIDIEGGEHEILMESPEVRAPVLDQICAHILEHG